LEVKEILLGPRRKGPRYQMIRVWGSGEQGIREELVARIWKGVNAWMSRWVDADRKGKARIKMQKSTKKGKKEFASGGGQGYVCF
jgi:hypothetical protein